MKDLRVNLTGDSSGYDAALQRSKREASEYADWWKAQLDKQKQAEIAASVEAARRSNQARRLLRQRAQDREAREHKAHVERMRQEEERAHNSLGARLRRGVGGFFGGITRGVGGQLAGVATFYTLQRAVRGTAEYAGQLSDLSERTNVSVEALQRFDRAAKENGSSLDALVGFWERLGAAREQALRDTRGSDAKAFERLGVSRQDLQTQNAESITRKIASALQNTANIEEIIAPLREIGGRGVGELVALFRAGLDQQYQDMQVMTGEQAAILDELDDKFSTLWQTIQIGLAGPLIKLIDWFRSIQNFFVKGVGGVQGAALNLEGASGVRETVGRMVEGFKTGWQSGETEVEQQAEEESARRAEKLKRSLEFKPLDLSDIDPKAVKEKKNKGQMYDFDADSLAKVGGYTGSALLFNPALKVANEQLRELKELNRKVASGNGINGYFP